MKMITAIMSTGSLRSATTRVRPGVSRRVVSASSALSLLYTASLLASLAGCNFSDDAKTDANSKLDLACGNYCAQGRFKVFSGQAVHLEIEPTGEMSQVFYNIDPASTLLKPVTLNKTAHISGHATGAEVMAADFDRLNVRDNPDSFSDILAIPSVNRISFLSPRAPTAKSRLQRDGGFGIDLLSGLSYTLILNPAGLKNHAPIHIDAGVINDDGRVDFVIDKNPLHLTGRVMIDDVPANYENGLPHIQARLMLGSRLISSVREIDTEGKFSLEVAKPISADASSLPLNLIIEPTDFETALPRIKQKLDIDVLNNDFDAGDINLGTLKKPLKVTFEVRGSDDSVISNAILYLRAPIGSGVALLKKQVNKSGETKFNHLYEGHYDIAVIPPVDSQFAMRVIKDVEFDSRENIQISIDLQKREGLSANVVGPLNEKVSGAQIQFARIGEIGNFATEDIYDDNLFKLTATTNDEGKVCNRAFGFTTADKNECTALLLDEGRYLAHIIPPAGSELAHKWITFDFPDKNELSIRLDQPEILVGQILKADGKTPASRAFVTVYLAETNMHNQPKMIGNAITDDKGFYRAFVSAP